MRKNKKRASKPRFRFAGRAETGDLEQAVAKLLTNSFHVDQVRLVPTFEPPKPVFNAEQQAAFERGERDIKMTNEQKDQLRAYEKFHREEVRIIPENEWDTKVSVMFNRETYYDKHVVLVPKDLLTEIFEALVERGITTKRGDHPRLESRYVKKRLELQRKAKEIK